MTDVAKVAAWQKLVEAAKEHTIDGGKETGQRLSDAAKAWAAASKPAPGVVKGTNGQTLRSGKTIPFGRSKGVAIEEADTKDLEWVAGALRSSIVDPAKERWAADNRQLLDAIEHELETR